MTTNITLSADAELIRKAREVARLQGRSLNALVREFLEGLVRPTSGEEAAKEYLRLCREHGGRSGGRKIARDELYEGRV